MARRHGKTDPAPELHNLVSRNVKTLLEARAAAARRKTRSDRIADAITRFTGSMRFVVVHAVLYGGWLLLNAGAVPWVKPWDPFPFVMLAMWASVEAIFLSTFVLISQNRMAEVQDRRADLDLQINLLAEYEITKLLALVDALAAKAGVEGLARDELEVLKQEVAPEIVLAEIQHQEERIEAAEPPPESSPEPSHGL